MFHLMMLANTAADGGISIDSDKINSMVNSTVQEELMPVMLVGMTLLLLLLILTIPTLIASICGIVKVAKANTQNGPVANSGLAIGILIAAIVIACVSLVLVNAILGVLALILCIVGRKIIKISV